MKVTKAVSIVSKWERRGKIHKLNMQATKSKQKAELLTQVSTETFQVLQDTKHEFPGKNRYVVHRDQDNEIQTNVVWQAQQTCHVLLKSRLAYQLSSIAVGKWHKL